MRPLALAIAFALPLALSAQSPGDVLLSVKSSGGPLSPTWVTKTSSRALGWDSGGNLTAIPVTASVAWGDITGKPSEFTPAAHNQAWSTITSTPTTLAGYGITDALTAATAASTYQPLDADLTSIAALATATFGRGLLTQGDAAAARSTLGLGTLATQNGTITDYLTTATAASTYQPLDADLTAIAALTTATFGRSLLTQTNAAGVRSALLLGTAAIADTSEGGNLGDDAGKVALFDGNGALSTNSLILVSLDETGFTSTFSGIYSANRTITVPDASGTLLLSGGALGTPSSGTLTNCTGLPVSGITSSTSAALGVGSIELGHATDTTLARSSAGVVTVEGSALMTTRTGVRRTLWLPAAAWIPRSTSGCGVDSRQTSTNLVNTDELTFDPSADQFAQISVQMPEEWNAGTVKAKVTWTATASDGTDDVVFTVAGVSIANDDALDTAFGTAQSTTDTLTAANDLDITPATSAITLSGAGAGEWVVLQLSRDADAAGDNLSVSARVLGVTLQYTESSTEPAAW